MLYDRFDESAQLVMKLKRRVVGKFNYKARSHKVSVFFIYYSCTLV